MASPVGRALGPYRVLRALGAGGMGETFLGERTGPAGFVHRVCIKRMRADDADPSWVAMFQTEARLVAMLAHPNIVSLVDYGTERDEWWMALALVEGADLRTVLTSLKRRGERMPIDLAVMVATEIAKGLAHAHTRCLPDGTAAGIVHRDLSPGNVMVSADGAVLLTDFGIAKVAHGERTRTGLIKGKAQYMSPEHASGDALDGRADLFALGVVLFEMLTGTRPFEGATDLASRLNAAQGKRPRLEDRTPEAPPALVAIVDRLLEPLRERRYADAREVLLDLDALPVRPSRVLDLGTLAARAQRDRDTDEGEPTLVGVPATRSR